MGYGGGLAWLNAQDRWQQIAVDSPVRDVRSFALAGNGRGSEIWVAFRNSGYFSRLRQEKDSWTQTTFRADLGYTPPDTMFVKRDSRGWIWRGTTKGVYISDGEHVGPDDWLRLDMRNGLSTDETAQYGFFEDRDGSIWISGEGGVTHLSPSSDWFQANASAPPLRLTGIEVNGTLLPVESGLPQRLADKAADVRIEIGSLGSSAFQRGPIRYRLVPRFSAWRVAEDATLLFPSLKEGTYTLEIAYTGKSAPDPITYEFQIGAGSAGLPWLWLWSVSLGGAALTLFGMRRGWFDRARYRISKAAFMLRRRLGGRIPSSSPGSLDTIDDWSGQMLLNRYQLIRVVARGGFSVVYEGRDLQNASKIAVKVVPMSVGQESWARDRFAQEVAALRSLSHPGIVKILDSWVNPGGQPCLVMEFVEGPTLRAALASGVLAPHRVSRLLITMGAALAEAHERGVVHRDLKPDNVILADFATSEERPVILDFGTAGLRGAQDELAVTTLLSGSFHYMAPERLTGRYSPATDTYALAVITLEMLTGKRLSDIRSIPSDPQFGLDLAATLPFEDGLDSVFSKHLALALDPVPARRPAVGPWTQVAADLLARGRR